MRFRSQRVVQRHGAGDFATMAPNLRTLVTFRLRTAACDGTGGQRRTFLAVGAVSFREASEMKISSLVRCALSSCVAAGMLAGCGGSQPPIGVAGTTPQRVAHSSPSDEPRHPLHGAQSASSSHGDLLYVASNAGGI